eukprot:TRINITY_DN49096_c0_g1_i1.p1 TRINITY_DN49096_c0_g1~~TRINITY_DN49096_c0_g1_i1.p1  ORF type:complete len:495 (-),score=79.68 TRINITY_DN49096_c0_g1_i1:57-1541(-)
MAANTRKGPRENGYVRRPSDFDDLHPHLMYGALMSSLRSLLLSFYDIAPAVLSLRVFAVGCLLAVPFVVFETLLQVALVAAVLAEICFFCWMRRVRSRLNTMIPAAERMLPADPQEVFRRTLATVDQCASWDIGRTPTEWLQGWLLKAPVEQIRQGNVDEFFAWAFFTKHFEELEEGELKQLRQMVEESERRYSWSWKEGYTKGVRPMRINFDSIQAWCHPLWYYASIRGLQLAARSTMQLMGFTYHSSQDGAAFYHRRKPSPPGLVLHSGLEAPPAAPPVVLIHGLGVGVAPYLRFIRRIATVRECFVVSLPEISQSCTENVLTPQAMADSLAAMLNAHGHEKAVFISHSYGTFVMSWVLQFRREIVAKTILMDPVALFLAQPDVAFNFLYRQPDNPMIMVIAHFVRWELFTAHVLMRHFYWHHNVLWKEDLPEDSVVVLGSHDDICNAHYVRHYLEDHKKDGKTHTMIWLEGFFHGAILLNRAAQLQVMDFL